MPSFDNRPLALTFALVLLAGVLFRILKADFSGIVYDEAVSFLHFGDSALTALTSYRNPNNNHVINSILIGWEARLFGSLDHFVRIHSTLFAVVFCLSAAYVVYRAVESDALRVALLLLVLFQGFVFDLSFLARGYSIALAAIFTELALMLWWVTRKPSYRARWLVIASVAGLDFVAFGSMLSSVFVLAGMGGAFVALVVPGLYRDAAPARRVLALHLVAIPAVFGLLSWLLYRNLYRDIFAARGDFGMASFGEHAVALARTLDGGGGSVGWLSLGLFALLVAAGGVTGLQIARERGWRWPAPDDAGSFVLWSTGLSMAAMFVHRSVLGLSLGFPRNSVFLIPLALIAAGVLLDRLGRQATTRDLQGRILRTAILVATIGVALLNLPEVHAIEVHDWRRQSAAGPLLRELRRLDPQKTWRVGLTEGASTLNLPLLYYRDRGHRVELARGREPDVIVSCQPSTLPAEPLLKERLFARFGCAVAVRSDAYDSPSGF